MTNTGIIGLIIIVVNIAFSYKGFTNQAFFDGYKFVVDPILRSRDYKRLISSGFLHTGWMHLIFNMVSLYFFSEGIEMYLGEVNFLIIYFASLIGGNLLSLFVHRNHGDYSAVGASGAVCGIIFANIALFPDTGIGLFFIPVSIPGWLYGILFVLFSIYGIKSEKDNIGHEAHLGGALVGMLVALLMEPSAIITNYLTILIITVPTIAFIYLIATKPHVLMVDNLFFKKNKNHYSIEHKYNEAKVNSQKELDQILDKINAKGIDSLSKAEKEKLDTYSKSVR